MPFAVTTRRLEESSLVRKPLGDEGDELIEVLIKIPDHFAIRPCRYGLLAPESPCEGFYTAFNIDIGVILALLHCSDTRRSFFVSYLDATVLKSTPVKIWPQAFAYLLANQPHCDSTISLQTFSSACSELYGGVTSLKITIAREAAQLGIKVDAGDNLRLEENVGVTIPRGQFAAQVLVLPSSALTNDCSLALHCDKDEWDDKRFQTEIVLTTVLQAIKADIVAERIRLPPLSLGYDGSRAVFEVRLDDSTRQLVLAARAGASSEKLAVLLSKFSGAHPSTHMRGERPDALIRMLAGLGEQPWCETCCGDARFKCLGCGGGALYCCSEHQKEDWKNHKTWCVYLPAFRVQTSQADSLERSLQVQSAQGVSMVQRYQYLLPVKL